MKQKKKMKKISILFPFVVFCFSDEISVWELF